MPRRPRTVLLLTALLMALPALAQVITLDRAGLLFSDSATPPVDDAVGWRPVTLPDQWGVEHYVVVAN